VRKIIDFDFSSSGFFELIENGIFESINITYIVSWVFVFWSEVNIN